MAGGSITRLRTRPDRAREVKAAELRQALLGFPGLPTQETKRILHALDHCTPAGAGWGFVMVSAEANASIVASLATNSVRPLLAVKAWALFLAHLDRATGEVLLTRAELAERLGCRPSHVSEVAGEMEKLGAVSRRKVPVPGVRGSGEVRIYVSPLAATHLPGEARAVAQAAAPALRLVPSPVP